MRVELVYFAGCEHAEDARERLTEAFSAIGIPPSWTEWDILADNTPPQYRNYASPTVLVEGRSVGGEDEGVGIRCAVGGGPSADAIAAAFREAGTFVQRGTS